VRSSFVTRGAVGLFLLAFFLFLFGPLIVMSITAFNSSTFPAISPWECLTFEWFPRIISDGRVQEGLKYSVIIGALVVLLSLALGLAGALMLTQIWPGARAVYYTIVTSPVLMPGIVIGIATVLFWDRVAKSLGAGSDSLFYHGIFQTVLAQSSFIAAYCMLVFVARLQRFDQVQMEAALDLGATNVQAFRKILLPFLRPAIFSAAVIAFLASFENYNTSVFTISHYSTFTIVIAQKVRLGLDPSISALAVIIILLTLFFALFNEAVATHSARNPQGALRAVLQSGIARFFVSNPAAMIWLATTASILAVVGYATMHSAEACKAEVRERKLEIQRKYATEPIVPAPTPGAGTGERNTGGWGDLFSTDQLKQGEGQKAPAEQQQPEQQNKGGWGDLFSPDTLNQTAPK
jgi:spermidine/putrescine transport system permease protein